MLKRNFQARRRRQSEQPSSWRAIRRRANCPPERHPKPEKTRFGSATLSVLNEKWPMRAYPAIITKLAKKIAAFASSTAGLSKSPLFKLNHKRELTSGHTAKQGNTYE
mmetsp:Transcript_7892/g.23737  ORF Transcript_7892/g.23737 Transcript_7892/m.23737 type:complete len:108 (-) Transcript_7892:1185-1508(-)